MLSFGFEDSSSMHFSTSYRCFSVSLFPGNAREDLENGGKIIMPPSALEILTRLNIQYPMIFKLTNKQAFRSSHCGVLEFVADEGNIYVPYWMLRNLLLEEGDRVFVTNTALPVATFAKFQPQTTDFLDITNPKAVLESALRSFACLTKGDIVALQYNQKIYELKVLETKPEDAVTIIECDMHVEFEAPLGYQDPSKNSAENRYCEDSKQEDDAIEVPIRAQGFQLDLRVFDNIC
ncbi:unnamed protein product [Protopolystoma xenopodis]|uniref:Ubiquitin fusion degradation protein UFD1 n=1 Tax=Protopolystoma xenopodis TaxID=117903 RepID=A0A3S5CIZ7_9PLAT|nr:unnamed protein product [Protopolystoma xenopodis]